MTPRRTRGRARRDGCSSTLWDAGLDAAEWQSWLAEGHDFGRLSAGGLPGHPPVVVPTHFTSDGSDLLIHLARPNPSGGRSNTTRTSPSPSTATTPSTRAPGAPHLQPDGDHAAVAGDQPPYGRMLPGIRGLRLEVTNVRDVPTARRQLRRLDRVGPRKP